MKYIPAALQKSFIGQQFIKIQRKVRGKKNFRVNKNEKSTSGFILGLKQLLPGLPRWIVPIVLVFIIITTFFVHVIQYNNIEVVPFDNADTENREQVSGSIHTALYGIKKLDGYIYVDYVAVIKQDDRIRIINTSPLFSLSGEKHSLRTALNFEPKEGQTKIESLNNSLSSVLGIRIDRYVLFDSGKIGEVIGSWEDSSLSESVYSDNLEDVRYVVDQSDASSEFFSKNFTWFSKYKLFWNLDEHESVIYTDMGKGELFNFFTTFDNRKNVVSRVVNIDHGVVDSTSAQSLSVLPNAILIDEQIAGFFSDVSVAAEQAELEIYNASDQRGLAYKFARQFQNIGINVVKYGNYFESADESIIYLETEHDFDRYRNTIREIQNTIGKATILIGAYQYNKSGDIIIVLN
jgi:hypothetical protein